MYVPDGDPDRREIWIVKKPVERQSLLVMSGRHGVFLLFRTTIGTWPSWLTASELTKTGRSGMLLPVT
jgi:hypothetical protein